MLGPIRWMDRFEWQKTMGVEGVAIFLNIPERLGAFEAWQEKYETDEIY